MTQNELVDEIPILKKVICGIAISENRYMATQLDNNPKNGVWMVPLLQPYTR